jgi:catechol 2,3-dioxygenase-like lactoylglutathione lyase family enzyme
MHHVTFRVSDLTASTEWYSRVLGAQHLPHLDHLDGDGVRFAVMLRLPGLGVPFQLRLVPGASPVSGYDPVTFAVADRDALDRWAAHLDSCGVLRSPVGATRAGHAVTFTDPDGTPMRLYLDVTDGASLLTPGGTE